MKFTAWPWVAALLGLGCPRAVSDILSIYDFSLVSQRFQVPSLFYCWIKFQNSQVTSKGAFKIATSILVH